MNDLPALPQIELFMPKCNGKPTRRGLVYAAIADTFVRQTVEQVEGASLSSRAVLDACNAWCQQQRLLSPSHQEVAQVMLSLGFRHAKSNGQQIWRDAAWVTEIDPWTISNEPDALRRLTRRSPVFALRVFIELAGIGRSTFYAMAARGDAPPHYRKGRRVFIVATDAIEWCRARGRHGAVLAIVDRAQDRWDSIDRARRHGPG